MKQVFSLTRKEVNSYFSSPMALIFVGIFLTLTLFVFFWVDGFWGRGIADVRPLFRWMPILLIFLVSALTMRQWSEEQQMGTLEMLLTLPMKLYQLVLGKFFAVLALVAVSLALTFVLPVTVSNFGNLDWGPVIGGYLASLLMASAYISIGLFVSSRTNNQIVALIVTAIICGLLHLVGSSQATDLVNTTAAEILRAIGTGSRFESIERGVIDLRDLVYYLSITAAFLALNVFSLDSRRWGKGSAALDYRFNMQTGVSLLAINLIFLNALLFPFQGARLDLTEAGEYSLSPVTKDLLSNLQEPLLIRGYFSEENHPLLAPLIPRITDMLEEYRIAADGKIELEILDPIADPEKETEANQTYGITPTPLQVSDRSGSSVINIYFDILIRYGDQNVVLNFGDLIEVDEFANGDFNVRLRNLEYDLTRSIKKVVFSFQSVDAVLASLDEPAEMTLYITPETLPEALAEAPATIEGIANEISTQSDGKFIFTTVNVNDPSNPVDPQALYDEYGIQPVAESFFSEDVFYLHIVLKAGDKQQVIYPSGEVSEAAIRQEIENALTRASSGFLKVVGLWTPPNVPQQDMFGQPTQSLQSFQQIGQILGENYEVQPVDLTQGVAPDGLDVLLVVAPQNMTDIERYAIDQYLMRGGTVFVAAGNFQVTADQFSGGLGLLPVTNGLQEMLTSYGVTVAQSLVMDEQNEPFPTPVTRSSGGFQVQEIQAIPYPFFVDVRQDGMDAESPILSDLPALTLHWASPVSVDASKVTDAQITTLLTSTDRSWVTTSTTVQPDLNTYPEFGFPVDGERGVQTLAVVVEGSFTSFFKDKPSPFTAAAEAAPADPTQPAPPPPTEPAVGSVETSPPTARLVVVGSSEFLNDNIFQLSSQFLGDRYLNTFQFIQNVVDWSTEDTDLLTIRSRGNSARLLDPLSKDDQRTWEIINYAVAIMSVIVLGVIWQVLKRSEQPMELIMPNTAD